MLEDLGSGVLFNLGAAGLKDEPTVKEVVSTGCDIVCFSGDKLLGGPQAGILVGKKAFIDRLSRHPLYRALRLDKVSLFLLEQTLLAYLSPQPEEILPVLSMVMTPVSDIKARAEKFARTVCDAGTKLQCTAVETNAAAGGGSLPGDSMQSYGIILSAQGIKCAKLAELLRSARPPVISMVQNEQVILDFRTISAAEESLLLQVILAIGTN